MSSLLQVHFDALASEDISALPARLSRSTSPVGRSHDCSGPTVPSGGSASSSSGSSGPVGRSSDCPSVTSQHILYYCTYYSVSHTCTVCPMFPVSAHHHRLLVFTLSQHTFTFTLSHSAIGLTILNTLSRVHLFHLCWATPVPSVPSVALLTIAPVPGSSRMIGVPVRLALITASYRGSAAGSGRGTSRSCVPAWLSLLELDSVRVLTDVIHTPGSSMASDVAPGEVVALVPVRSKATVLDDIASGPPWLMVLGPAAAISETSSSLGVPAWSLSSKPTPVEDIGSLSALTKATPLADGELEVLSVALVAIAPVPLFIAAAGRSPKELGRSCLVRAGGVVSARWALLLSLCPRVCSWPGFSISIIALFVPFLEDMLIIGSWLSFAFRKKTKDQKSTSCCW